MDGKEYYSNKRIVVYDNGYVLDRAITRIAMGVIFILLLVIMCVQGFDFSKKIYFRCDNPLSCDNPFYIDPNCKEGRGCYNSAVPLRTREICSYDWCEQKYLRPGIYGEPPPNIYKLFLPASIIILILSLIINHFIYNRRFKVKGAE